MSTVLTLLILCHLLNITFTYFIRVIFFSYSVKRKKKHRFVHNEDITTMYTYPSVTTLTYIPHHYGPTACEKNRRQSTSLLSVHKKYASTSELNHIHAPSKVRLLQGASTLSLVDGSSIIQQTRERLFSPNVDWRLFRSRESLDRDMFEAPRKVGSRRSIVSYL